MHVRSPLWHYYGDLPVSPLLQVVEVGVQGAGHEWCCQHKPATCSLCSRIWEIWGECKPASLSTIWTPLLGSSLWSEGWDWEAGKLPIPPVLCSIQCGIGLLLCLGIYLSATDPSQLVKWSELETIVFGCGYGWDLSSVCPFKGGHNQSII